MRVSGRSKVALFVVAIVVAIALLLLVVFSALDSDLDSRGTVAGGDRSEVDGDASSAEFGATDDTEAGRRAAAGARGKLIGLVKRRGDDSVGSGLEVRLIGPDGVERTVLTDADGRFEFDEVNRRTRFTLSLISAGFAPIRLTDVRLGRHRRKDVGTLWLAPGAHAVVQVRSTRGEWVKGAHVEAFAFGPSSTGFEPDDAPSPVVVSRTNTEGRAEFPRISSGRWLFVVRAGGRERRSTGVVTLAGGVGKQRFLVTVGDGRSVKGTVRDRDGRPLARVAIVALRRSLPNDAERAPLAVRTRSGRDGEFQLDGLPTGDVVLWAARPGGPLYAAIAVTVPRVDEVELVLPDPVVVAGTVTQQVSGEPVAFAPVSAAFRSTLNLPHVAHGETDENGHFEMLLPGAGTLIEVDVDAPGLFLTHDGVSTPRYDVSVHEGARVETEITMVAGVAVRGVVRSGGTALPRARVSAKHEHETREVRTDGDGRFQFDGLRPGTTSLTARRSPFSQRTQSVEVPDDRENPGIDVEFDLPASRVVEGRVRDREGAAIEGAEIRVEFAGNAVGATSDRDGHYRLGAVNDEKEVWIVAEASGFSPSYRKIGAGQQSDVDITLARLVTVRGRVSTSDGGDISGAVMQAAGVGGDLPHPTTMEWSWLGLERHSVEPDGTFDHRVAITQNSCVVRISVPGYAATVTQSLRIPSNGVVEVDLTLDRGFSISGRIRSDDGRDVSGAWLAVIPLRDGEETTQVAYPGAWGPPVAAVTDDKGRFTITGLHRVPYGLRVRHADYREITDVFHAPSSGVFLTLARLYRVRCRVERSAGKPLAGARVHATQGDDKYPAIATDAQGDFGLTVARGSRVVLRVDGYPDMQFELQPNSTPSSIIVGEPKE